jgi:hypothetical protein
LIQAGGVVDIQYASPLNRAQRSEDGVAILRTLESVTPLAQVDPSVLDVFDAEAIVRELADINGVPAKVLRTPDQVKALKDQQAQASQAQALLQAAPVVSGSVKDLAQAQALAGAAPAQQAPAIFPS